MLNRRSVLNRAGALGAMLAAAPLAGASAAATIDDGVISVRSVYGFAETIERLRADIAAKKIMFFEAIDQAKLAMGAGISLLPSTLLVFGNPPLGIQFLTARPAAGLDWPVRLLVTEDEQSRVWTTYTDFAWIARRHGIADRAAAFQKASEVVASITSSVAAK